MTMVATMNDLKVVDTDIPRKINQIPITYTSKRFPSHVTRRSDIHVASVIWTATRIVRYAH